MECCRDGGCYLSKSIFFRGGWLVFGYRCVNFRIFWCEFVVVVLYYRMIIRCCVKRWVIFYCGMFYNSILFLVYVEIVVIVLFYFFLWIYRFMYVLFVWYYFCFVLYFFFGCWSLLLFVGGECYFEVIRIVGFWLMGFIEFWFCGRFVVVD